MKEVLEEIQMRLSTIGIVLPLTLSLLVVLLCSDVQQARKVSRIGWLLISSPLPRSPMVDAFQQRLHELGSMEGQNLAIEYRWAEGKLEQLPDLAADLVRLPVDVIVPPTGTATRAAKLATSTIPIVFAGSGDAMAQGLVASLARPGGNVTGVAHMSTELTRQRLELLKEAVPGLSHVAVLCDPPVSWPSDPLKDVAHDMQWREMESVAHALGVHLQSLEVRGPADLEGAFAAATRDRAEALVVLDCAPLNVRRVFQGIIDLAAMHRLPAMYHSFQHGREASADALAAEMARSAIRQAKLPFIESPDHDTLLDQVKQEIRDCDVFVCVPGSRPSFVESEVSMAFGLEKPLLFVLIEADTPRLPNTAKKGYPVFALERFQREGFGTLVNFCSYPAADWRSTVRLYGAVLAHIRACAKLAGAICLVSIVALTRVMGASAMPDHTDPGGSFLGWTQAFVSNRAILWIIATSLVLFLVPYGLFSMTRLVLRAKLRRVIAGKKFSDSFLPETLAYSLTRADLLKDGPKSYAELATAAGAHPGALYRLLRMLASVGMFAEVGHGHFTLIPLTTLLFDRPHVLEGAQRGVEAAGVGDRCEIVPRDFFTAVPAGGDVYILKWVLLDWEDEHALTILRNCHRVMQDQGKLLVVEMLIPPGNAPFAGKVIDLGILVSVPGRHRTEAEYRGLLSAAGFTLSRVIPTKSPRQVSILESLRA
jgi:putative ABC transport system substrate-binding protein